MAEDADHTIDGFLDNQFRLVQPKSGGHRAGLDGVLLAATVPPDASGRIADLGAGCGVVGFAIAHRCPKVTVDQFELCEDNLACLAKGLGLQENQHFASRVTAHKADVTKRAVPPLDYLSGRMNFIVANPPFNSSAKQASQHRGRALAHQHHGDLFEQWIRTAAHLAKHGAKACFIIPADMLGQFLPGFEARFGDVAILPVRPRSSTPASRLLIGGTFGSAAPLNVLPDLVLHEENGTYTTKADAILRGKCGLELKSPR